MRELLHLGEGGQQPSAVGDPLLIEACQPGAEAARHRLPILLAGPLPVGPVEVGGVGVAVAGGVAAGGGGCAGTAWGGPVSGGPVVCQALWVPVGAPGR